MFEELPIIIKNSHLGNVMLAELALSTSKAAQSSSAHLELGTRRFFALFYHRTGFLRFFWTVDWFIIGTLLGQWRSVYVR